MSTWLIQVLVAIDQLVNALGGGWADETISARAWRLNYRQPFKTYRRVIDGLFFFQADHCKKAYQAEQQRLQLPPALRDPQG